MATNNAALQAVEEAVEFPIPAPLVPLLKKKGIKIENVVFSTKKYSLFTHIKGNRDIDWKHVEKLMYSMTQEDLKIPIVVNEDFGVVDGQHRLEARRKGNLPVYFTMEEAYGLSEIRRANDNMKEWDAENRMQSFVALGYPIYVTYKAFKEEYGFGHQETQLILSGKRETGKSLRRMFKDGRFEIPNLKWSHETAQKIRAMGAPDEKGVPMGYPGYKRKSFVLAMMDLFKEPSYDHEFFLQKLYKQPRALTHCVNKVQYKEMLVRIYNWNTRRKDMLVIPLK